MTRGYHAGLRQSRDSCQDAIARELQLECHRARRVPRQRRHLVAELDRVQVAARRQARAPSPIAMSIARVRNARNGIETVPFSRPVGRALPEARTRTNDTTL